MLNTFRPPKILPRWLTTHVLEGLRLHETLYGSLAIRNSLKNVLVAALLLINGYATVRLAFYADKTRYIPFPLLVREDGSYQVLSPPEPSWSPLDGMAVDDVRQLIYALRSVLMDPTENTRRWQRVLARTTERGQHQAEAAYWALKEELKTFRGVIQVEIATILARQALQTYEVIWTETRFDENKDRDRGLKGLTRWRGVFTVKFEAALINPNTCPDGIVYDSWVISEEK